MINLRTSRSTAVISLAFLVLAPVTLYAQSGAEADTREISNYALTDAGLAKYTQATKNLGALAKQASDCDEEDEGESAQSISATVARFDAVPGTKASIQSAGMTTREYIVFSWSLLQNGLAAWAAAQPGGQLPPGVSMANVNFYRQHEAELQRLGQLTQSSDCDEEVEDEESEES